LKKDPWDVTEFFVLSKEPRPQGGALKPKTLNPKTRSRNKFGMTKRPKPNRHVMLNLFQHLVCLFSAFSKRIFHPRPQDGALKPKLQNPKPRSRNKFGMTKRPEPNRHVMLNLFQHLVCLFSAFSRRIFHPRPQEGVFRREFNKRRIVSEARDFTRQ
jgi:hypothetical protein